MSTGDVSGSLATLFRELLYGTPEGEAYVLNRGDIGLLRALDALPAEAASRIHGDGSSVAAHVEHLRYGLSLMNRWAGGENPFADANWAASWARTGMIGSIVHLAYHLGAIRQMERGPRGPSAND